MVEPAVGEGFDYCSIPAGLSQIDTRRSPESLAVTADTSLPSRSPMLSISPSRIREIADPMTRMLNQLHKILFISQLYVPSDPTHTLWDPHPSDACYGV